MTTDFQSPVYLKIHSGGQTGADLAGLWVAQAYNLPTGGWAPQGYKTLIGDQPTLGTLFGLKDWGSYRQRTIRNVSESDLTMIFGSSFQSPGTKLTISACLKHKKTVVTFLDPRTDVVLGDLVAAMSSSTVAKAISEMSAALVDKLLNGRSLLSMDDYTILNIAGNATKNVRPEVFELTFVALTLVLDQAIENLKSRNFYLVGTDHNPVTSSTLTVSERYKLAQSLKDRFDAEINPAL